MFGKSEKFKISCILEKTLVLEKILVLYIVCSKCKNEDEKIFKEEESIWMLEILGLI